MKDKEFDDLLDKFIDACKEKNFKSVVMIGDKNCQLIKTGAHANYFEAVTLISYWFKHFQDRTKIPAISMLIFLAITSAIGTLKPEFEGKLSDLDAETLTQVGQFVKEVVDIYISHALIEKKQTFEEISPILQ